MSTPQYLTPFSAPKPRRAMRLLLVGAMTVGLLWIALTAVASCSYNHVFGWATPNDTFYSDNVVQCNPDDLEYSRLRIQEKVLFVWVTRAQDSWSGSTNNAILVDLYYDCSGHGTDLWRSRADWTSSTGGFYNYEPGPSGQSYSCP